MKITNLQQEYENYDEVVKITDFEHFFNIYVDKQNNYKYNLNSSLYFDMKYALAFDYTLKYDSHWPLISYNIYNTTRLAWLLMKLNNVKPVDVFNIIPAGSKIKYLSVSLVQKIVEELQ